MINLADLRLYIRLLKYLKPHKWRMTAAIVAMLGVSALTACWPTWSSPSWTTSFSPNGKTCSSRWPALVVVLYLVKGVFPTPTTTR